MKTNELTDRALDYAVAKCEGYFDIDMAVVRNGVVRVHYFDEWAPTTDWSQGGPIIERERICITYPRWDGQATALKIVEEFDDRWEMHGPTPLIAAMRCYVASRLGDDVKIPTELQGEIK